MGARPRLLDLFWGGGGCSVGYHRAGFDVVGVDLSPQPRYPYEFHQGDALEFPLDGFDVVHASPPCQADTTMSNRWRGQGGKADFHPRLINETRDRLVAAGVVFVIENVPGAKRWLRSPVRLHGGMFGLGVDRTRLFESNVLLWAPRAPRVKNPVGVYGKAHDGRLLWRRQDGSEQRAARSLQEARDVMGIDYMEWRELAEAIPPAYTEFLGRQLIAALG